MLAEQRRLLIIDLLIHKKDSVTVAELSDLLNVSAMTVRRDLDTLERTNMIRRVHGGAIAKSTDAGKPFNSRSAECAEEKRRIGRLAASLVQVNEKILFDAGTTTLQIASALGGSKAITAITHALPIAQTLSGFDNVTTIILGGILKQKEQCAIGPMVIQDLSRLSVDTVFLSAGGFDLDKGVTDPDLLESEVKQAMMHSAMRVVLVADSSKAGCVCLIQISDWSGIHMLVTDDGISDSIVSSLEGLGVKVLTPARALPPEEGA
jgi:DeoR/GlpR family transcriptional regulator of sugar metabolism